MASAFNVASLASYSNQSSKELFAKMFLGFQTLDSGAIRVVDTVKESIKLKFQTDTVTFQAGGCGFNASGTVLLTEKEFTNKPLKVDIELCENDLDGTSFEVFENAGSNDGLQAELLNKIVDQFTKQINNTLEKNYWAGTTATTQMTGILTYIDADTDFSGSLSGNAITYNWATATGSTEIVSKVQTIYNTLADEAQNAAVMFCGYDTYNKIAQAALAAYSYNIGFSADAPFPGTDMKLVKVTGLSGKHRVVATAVGNLVYVCDTVDEASKSKVWYSMDDQIVKATWRFKAGSGYFFNNYIVYTKTA